MSGFWAFTKKEFVQLFRSGKLVLLLILCVLFGIMNPAIAKLTPWMMESMAGAMEESGLVISAVEATVLSSWTQFFKNAPMAVVIFLLMFGGTMTGELQKGTLVNMVTKGLKRWKILGAKALAALLSWSVFYWLMYAITYGYNVYFWKEEQVSHAGFAAAGTYLAGLWLLLLVIFCSVFVKSGTAAVALGGVGYLLSYVLGMIPTLKEYVPTYLMSMSGLLTKSCTPEDFYPAVGVTLVLTVVVAAVGILGFNRKEL